MFDLSFAEISVIALVGLFVIGPKDLPDVIRFCKKLIDKIKNIGNDFISSITEDADLVDIKQEAQKVNDSIRTIIDLDGNEQDAYDIRDLLDKREKEKMNSS